MIVVEFLIAYASFRNWNKKNVKISKNQRLKEKVKSKKGNKKKEYRCYDKERQGSKVRMEETVGETR